MAEGVLGLGTGGASALNNEVIEKLKTAEAKVTVEPYITQLEEWDEELEKTTEVETKLEAVLDAASNFDLFKDGANAFEQKSASTSGSSVVFDAVDVTTLENGVTSVNITQLAQRDVFQTNTFIDKTALVNGGQDDGDKISITIGGETHDFDTIGKTYEDLAGEINFNLNFIASVEKVGDNEYRLIVKSANSGMENELSFSNTGIDLGLENEENHTVKAQNLNAVIDGINYNTSSNTIELQSGLSISAVSVGESAISIASDTSNILTQVNEFVTAYNDFSALIEEELYSGETPLQDTTSIKMMFDGIKNMLFEKYGEEKDQNVYNYGFSLDKYGQLSVNETIFTEALKDNADDLEALFVGTAENKGLGTKLKEYIEDLNGYNGIMTNYGDSLDDRKEKLEEEKEKAQTALDAKYDLMTSQFASYGALITTMEVQFSGLKQTIAEAGSSS